MSVGIFLFVTFVFLLIFGLGIWLLYVIFKKEDLDPDATIALNFLSNYANGRFLGIEKNVMSGKSNRKIIEIEPKDIRVKKDSHKKIENEKVIVDNRKILSLPRGTLSKERNVNIYLPINSDDLPEALKNSEFGVALIYASGLKELKDAEIKLLREGGRSKDELLKKISDGELSKEFITRTEEYVKDFLKMTIQAKDDKKSQSLSTLTTGGIHNE